MDEAAIVLVVRQVASLERDLEAIVAACRQLVDRRDADRVDVILQDNSDVVASRRALERLQEAGVQAELRG
ncbi:MAG: hypothetical protein M3173_04775 [Chloroflexota bacterium]|nr:hypothetical protein [Chloroflexota bacterium]